LPPQHESFNEQWRTLSDQFQLIPQHVRTIGPTIIGPGGEELTVATKVMLHPSLVDRLGQLCTTILDEAPDRREQGEYRPGNVQADTLPVFA
jgi:hypothetical protein